MRGRSVNQICDPGPRARAFTLIEVLVVVLILGIASALILPEVSGQDDMSAAAAARTVMGDLLYAQNRAIAMQQYAYVAFNQAGQSYSLYDGTSAGPATTPLTHPVNGINYVMTFGKAGPNNVASDVTLGSVNFNGQSTIAFDETGVPYFYSSGPPTPLTGTGSIRLNSGSYSVTVSVAQDTGEITVN
ncbi:MAG: type II secretion system protein [Tepidisphaeraceae bacterium]|jgi:prepilin-type N-terminal cleavage/methylation domain-containing protein